MSRLRVAWLPALLLISAALTLFGFVSAWSARLACTDLERRISEADAEADSLMEGSDPEEIVVDAPMVTWADMIHGLHSAAAESGLDRFSYDTTGVVGLRHPGDRPLQEAGEGGDNRSETGGDDSEEEVVETEEPVALPYRAMLAQARGSGPFESIVAFSAALARVEPALALDEFTIFAEEPHPRFEARVRLVSSLPVSLESLSPTDMAQAKETQR